jgi:hypothetical protein
VGVKNSSDWLSNLEAVIDDYFVFHGTHQSQKLSDSRFFVLKAQKVSAYFSL